MINGFLVNLGFFYAIVVVTFLLQHNPKGVISFNNFKNISSALNSVMKTHQCFLLYSVLCIVKLFHLHYFGILPNVEYNLMQVKLSSTKKECIPNGIEFMLGFFLAKLFFGFCYHIKFLFHDCVIWILSICFVVFVS